MAVQEVEQRAREMADQMFTDEPVIVDEEPDLQSMFARLLWKEDWTDKVSSGLGKIFHRANESGDDNEEEFPEELLGLIPDMNEVEKAYNEMTSDYLDFIRTVWQAQQTRKQQSQLSQDQYRQEETE